MMAIVMKSHSLSRPGSTEDHLHLHLRHYATRSHLFWPPSLPPSARNSFYLSKLKVSHRMYWQVHTMWKNEHERTRTEQLP